MTDKTITKAVLALCVLFIIIIFSFLIHTSNKNDERLRAVADCIHYNATQDTRPDVRNNPASRTAWDLYYNRCDAVNR